MREYIRKLQAKPEHVRKQILAGTLIVSMFVVGFIWVNTVAQRLGSRETAVKAKEDIKPFALFGQSISNAYQNISASVGNISSSLKGSGNTAPRTNQGKQIDLIPVGN